MVVGQLLGMDSSKFVAHPKSTKHNLLSKTKISSGLISLCEQLF